MATMISSTFRGGVAVALFSIASGCPEPQLIMEMESESSGAIATDPTHAADSADCTPAASGGCISEGSIVDGAATYELSVESASLDAGVVATYGRAGHGRAGLALRLRAEIRGDQIESRISTADGTILTELTIPSGGGPADADIRWRIEQAASTASARFADSHVGREELVALRGVYRTMMDELFLATAHLPEGPLGYSLPYHASVLTAVLDGAATIHGSGHGSGEDSLVPCQAHGHERAVPFHYEADHPARASAASEYVPELEPAHAAQQCGLGWGSACGCCGNYDFCCLYWSNSCLAHDMLCTSCDSWVCGWGCVPTDC